MAKAREYYSKYTIKMKNKSTFRSTADQLTSVEDANMITKNDKKIALAFEEMSEISIGKQKQSNYKGSALRTENKHHKEKVINHKYLTTKT